MPESSGKSWFGWKFSQRLWEIGGELRVTRYRSGGVPGTMASPGLNGVVDRPSVVRYGLPATSRAGVIERDVGIGAKEGTIPCIGPELAPGVSARDRS